MTFLEANESSIRLSVFFGVFVLMALLEALRPRKKRTQSRGKRWFSNLGLVVVNSVILRLTVPVLAVEMAVIAAEKGWGVLSLVTLPFWLEVMIAVVLLDVLIYAQHVASHKIPLLWRLHKVHHVDRDIDVTTGARFHPVEIIVSMGYKLLCVMLIGPAATAVILFEVLLNGSAMFNHANLRLPLWLDRLLRTVVITPDVHRVHHSTVPGETDNNYGFFLSFWDRIFGTYTAQPQAGHDKVVIGVEEYQSEKPASLIWCLLLPFKAAVPVEETEAKKGAAYD